MYKGTPARLSGVPGEDLKRIRCQLPLSKQGGIEMIPPLLFHVMTGNSVDSDLTREQAIHRQRGCPVIPAKRML
jgi:hypothetical protein